MRIFKFRNILGICVLITLSVCCFLRLFAQQLEIHHINVGQGDATLIISPTGVTMLIDAGNWSDGTNIICPYLDSLGITKLNYVVCSHYHTDHLGGLDEVISHLGVSNIDTVYDRGSGSPLPRTQGFFEYITAAEATGRRYAITLGQILNLGGGVTMKCVATNGEVINFGTVSNATSSENDLSIGWLLNYDKFQYFTGGDLGGDTSSYADNETPLAAQVGDVDALKVNHHGSRYSTNQTFVDSLRPEVAIIDVGDGNSYRHPTQTILDRLAAANCFIYQTELGTGGTIPTGKGVVANGDIVIRTSGASYTVSYGNITTTYPGEDAVTILIKPEDAAQTFSLSQNYPNPFNTTTSIQYNLSTKAHVYLNLYAIDGRLVQSLVNNFQSPGLYTFNLDALNLSSGVYFYALQVGELRQIRKCLLIK